VTGCDRCSEQTIRCDRCGADVPIRRVWLYHVGTCTCGQAIRVTCPERIAQNVIEPWRRDVQKPLWERPPKK
jgi:hypothetical protein